jgi:flagellar hook assembly protein FlgD
MAFALLPITPNPTVRNAMIRYVVPGSGKAGVTASVRVFDVSGRVVRVLASGPHTPGAHTISWDGLNSAGAQVDAGVFFVELAAGSNRSVHRVVLLR